MRDPNQNTKFCSLTPILILLTLLTLTFCCDLQNCKSCSKDNRNCKLCTENYFKSLNDPTKCVKCNPKLCRKCNLSSGNCEECLDSSKNIKNGRCVSKTLWSKLNDFFNNPVMLFSFFIVLAFFTFLIAGIFVAFRSHNTSSQILPIYRTRLRQNFRFVGSLNGSLISRDLSRRGRVTRNHELDEVGLELARREARASEINKRKKEFLKLIRNKGAYRLGRNASQSVIGDNPRGFFTRWNSFPCRTYFEFGSINKNLEDENGIRGRKINLKEFGRKRAFSADYGKNFLCPKSESVFGSSNLEIPIPIQIITEARDSCRTYSRSERNKMNRGLDFDFKNGMRMERENLRSYSSSGVEIRDSSVSERIVQDMKDTNLSREDFEVVYTDDLKSQ